MPLSLGLRAAATGTVRLACAQLAVDRPLGDSGRRHLRTPRDCALRKQLHEGIDDRVDVELRVPEFSLKLAHRSLERETLAVRAIPKYASALNESATEMIRAPNEVWPHRRCRRGSRRRRSARDGTGRMRYRLAEEVQRGEDVGADQRDVG